MDEKDTSMRDTKMKEAEKHFEHAQKLLEKLKTGGRLETIIESMEDIDATIEAELTRNPDKYPTTLEMMKEGVKLLKKLDNPK